MIILITIGEKALRQSMATDMEEDGYGYEFG